MHHLPPHGFGPQRILLAVLVVALAAINPDLALAQASPFMTGASALQTNILAWLTPVAIILVMVLGGMAMANRLSLGLVPRRHFRNCHRLWCAANRDVGSWDVRRLGV